MIVLLEGKMNFFQHVNGKALALSHSVINVSKLVNFLRSNTRITELSLLSCNIDDKGAEALANGNLSNLTSLNLSGNGIGDLGAEALANGNLSNLTSLNLDGNEEISVQGANVLAEVLVNSSFLKLSFNVLEDEKTWTPLHLAGMNGRTDVINALIGRGAKVDAKDKQGMTPLHFASMNGRTDAINALIGRGAKVDAKDKQGMTPLHLAGMNGRTDAINALIGRGANVNAEDKQGMTPLNFASMNGRTDAINALIRGGANVNAMNRQGWTPLYGAVIRGNEEAVKLLIAHKVKLNPGAQKPEYLVQHNLEYWDKCLKEVQEMKQEGIGNNITLYDILRDNDANKLISYTQGRKMVQMSEEGSCGNKFPIYGGDLERLLNKIGKQREDALNVGEMVTKRFGNFYDGCHMRKEGPFNLKIAEYLSNEDIKSLRKAAIQTIDGKKGSQKASTSQQSAQAAVDDRPSSSLSISSLSSNDGGIKVISRSQCVNMIREGC